MGDTGDRGVAERGWGKGDLPRGCHCHPGGARCPVTAVFEDRGDTSGWVTVSPG